jgi:hypothetical protein
MPSKLVLYKPELNPDVYFENPPVSFWNFGTGWTFGTNNTNGLGAEKLGVANSFLTLYLNDGNYGITGEVLKPYRTYKYTIRAEFVTNAGGGDYCKFQIGGNDVYTLPASAGSAIYTGTFTTGASGTVRFSSTSGNSVLLSYLKLSESPETFDIDLTEDIEVPLTYAIADIVDPDKRDSSYSKTVKIPGTKNNNLFFNHVYEISAEGIFNVNKKIKCEVYTDDLLQFTGFAKLDGINRTNNGINNYSDVNYDITLFGDLGDFFFELGDTLLSDLDFSEYDHDYTKANQFNSWYTSIIRNGATYSHVTNGSYLTVSSCQYNGGRVQMNFSGAHGLVAGDWVLFPEGSINYTLAGGPELYYLGEHMVYEVVSATAVVLQCPYFAAAGSITTVSVGTDRVRKHSKTGRGYVYPMTDRDQTDGALWEIKHFFPNLFVYEILTKMFQKVKFVWESDIIDSVIFKKLVADGCNGLLKLSPDEIESRLFQAKNTNNQNSTFTLSQVGGWYTNLGTSPSALDLQIDDDSTAPMFDNAGVYNTGTYRYTCSDTGIYTLNFAAIIKFGTTGTETNTGYASQMAFAIDVVDYTANVIVPNCTVQFAPTTIYQTSSNSSNYIVSTSVDNCYLTSGNTYGVRLRVISTGSTFWTGAGTSITIQYGVIGGTVFFGNKVVNTALQAGDTVYMNSLLPKMKCTEFFANIIRMFNLYITTDKLTERKLYIQTRDNFYDNGEEIDWTSKMDISQNIRQVPMAQLQAKIMNYNYEKGGDFYNKDHSEKFGATYGNLQKRVDNDFKKGEYTTGVTFASTVLVDLYGKVVSNIQAGTDTDSSNDAMSDKLRILYFNCASTQYLGWNVKTDPTDTLGTTHRMYPYAGHLDKPDAPYHDLNWWYPRGVYFAYDSWTDRNLFNLYHKKTWLEQVDPEGRMLIAYMHLTAKDINSLDFRNRFRIHEHVFRLNKIIDYSVGKNVPVLCEFIKALDIPNFTTQINYNFELGTGWIQEGFDFYLGKYVGEGNGYNQGADSKVLINGASYVGKYSYNVIVNGNDNYVGNSSSNILITGSGNKVPAGATDIVMLNCTDLEVTLADCGMTFIENKRIIRKGWTTINASSSPYTIDGSQGDKYLIDLSAGDIDLIIIPSKIGANEIYLKIIDATNNLNINTEDNAGTIDLNALPYTISPTVLDCYEISSDNGIDLQII